MANRNFSKKGLAIALGIASLSGGLNQLNTITSAMETSQDEQQNAHKKFDEIVSKLLDINSGKERYIGYLDKNISSFEQATGLLGSYLFDLEQSLEKIRNLNQEEKSKLKSLVLNLAIYTIQGSSGYTDSGWRSTESDWWQVPYTLRKILKFTDFSDAVKKQIDTSLKEHYNFVIKYDRSDIREHQRPPYDSKKDVKTLEALLSELE